MEQPRESVDAIDVPLVGLLVSLEVVPALAGSIAAEVEGRMAESHRRYHGLDHIRAVLGEVDRLLPDEPAATPAAVRLAAWFHDVIYDPTAPVGANEQASAELAVHLLTPAGIDPAVVDETARLIRLTAGHNVEADDRSGAVLVDADLGILASPPADYDRYATAVREEYAHVPDDLWVAGRGAVLRGFLESAERLFTAGPPPDRSLRRGRAVANLHRELTGLTSESS